MNIDNKYEESLLETATNLDAVTRSKGRIHHCATRVIKLSERKDIVELVVYITKFGKSEDSRIRQIAIALKDSLFMLHGIRSIEKICKSNEKTSVGEKEKTLDELLNDLDHLVGLHNVKSKVSDLICFQKVQKLRKGLGLSSPKSTLHLAFTGNPGTGKTTVARIVGRIYKQIGILSKGHFVEVSRTDLIAGFQGQTAHKVKHVIERARGGVLFIDEAYSITENEHTDSYGRECLTELTKALEDYRDDLVVIVAGYTEPMIKFFESNPGLKSRFNTFLEFEDYTPNELLEIFKSMCSKEDYSISELALSKLFEKINSTVNAKDSHFANGRFIRNIFEDMIMNHARRLAKIGNPNKTELQELKEMDLP